MSYRNVNLTDAIQVAFETVEKYKKQNPDASLTEALKQTGVSSSSYYRAARFLGDGNSVKPQSDKNPDYMNREITPRRKEIYETVEKYRKQFTDLPMKTIFDKIAAAEGKSANGLNQEYYKVRKQLGLPGLRELKSGAVTVTKTANVTLNKDGTPRKRPGPRTKLETLSTITEPVTVKKRPVVQAIAYTDAPEPVTKNKLKFVFMTGTVDDIQQLLETMGD